MFSKYRLLIAIIASFGSIYAQSTVASVQGWWTLNGNCVTGGCNTSSRTFAGDHGNLVTATAWSNTANIGSGTNNRLATAEIMQYSGGLGVRNADWNTSPGDPGEDAQPEHAMDNDGRFDMILFEFNDASNNNVQVSLEKLAIGWYNTDADISVLAYSGSGPFNLADDLTNRTIDGNFENLSIGNGGAWEVIGNYDVDAYTNNTAILQPDADNDDINDNNNKAIVSSSYWLIGAYNPVFVSAGCDPVDTWCNGPDTSYPDYLKIMDLVGTIVPPGNPDPPLNVPEPSSLILLASALFIAPGLRRRNRNKLAK